MGLQCTFWPSQPFSLLCMSVFFEGKVAISLSPHGDLDVLTDTVQVDQQALQPLWTMRPHHKCVIEVTKPADRLVGHLL